MKRRQTSKVRHWLIADARLGDELWPIAHKLPPEGGVLVLFRDRSRRERQAIIRRLRRGSNRLLILDEASGDAARVHDARELRQALLKRTPLILLSPLYPTASHPDWTPLPRMRAAALARLAGRRLVALGGMNLRRYAKVAPLGFIGWAGISAFRT